MVVYTGVVADTPVWSRYAAAGYTYGATNAALMGGRGRDILRAGANGAKWGAAFGFITPFARAGLARLTTPRPGSIAARQARVAARTPARQAARARLAAELRASRTVAQKSVPVPKYVSEVKVGGYLAGKAPTQVQPGTRVLTGQYFESTGVAPRVQPWTAHYDEYGRLVARTDYNAGNAVAGIPDTHYTTFGYNNGVRYEIQNHIAGAYQP